jgi:hypothetical protein
MKTKSDFTYKQAILLGVLTELILIAIQFIYIKIYVSLNPGENLAFDTDYMRYRGFYVFQIIGFFVYTFTVYMIINRYHIRLLNYILAYLITGGIVELSFYLMIQADYEGAFIYSVLDKFIAAVFGAVLFFYGSGKVKTS